MRVINPEPNISHMPISVESLVHEVVARRQRWPRLKIWPIGSVAAWQVIGPSHWRQKCSNGPMDVRQCGHSGSGASLLGGLIASDSSAENMINPKVVAMDAKRRNVKSIEWLLWPAGMIAMKNMTVPMANQHQMVKWSNRCSKPCSPLRDGNSPACGVSTKVGSKLVPHSGQVDPCKPLSE